MTQTDPTPSAWTDGGRGTVIHWDVAQTSLGPMLVAASAKGVVRLSFGENPAVLADRFPNAELVQGGADFAKLLADIVQAAEAPGETDFDHIPVDVSGTPFQQSVWQALRRIPKGATC